MPFRGVAKPETLSALQALHKEMCSGAGVQTTDPMGELIAARMMALFTAGMPVEKISETLRNPARHTSMPWAEKL